MLRKLGFALIIVMSGILTPILAFAEDAPLLAGLNGASFVNNAKAFNAAQFAGKKTILMFWKSDCAPCLTEMTGFDKIRAAAGNVPIIIVTPTWGKKEQYFLQKPTQNSAYIVKSNNFSNLLEYFGDPEGGVPYSVMFNEKGLGCISNLGPLNAKVMHEMFNECAK